MRRMIAHPEVLGDHLGDAPTGPDIAAKAKGFRAFEEQGDELGVLVGRQQGRGAGRRMIAQGVDAIQAGAGEPLADGALGDAQGVGDLLLGPAVLMQLPSA